MKTKTRLFPLVLLLIGPIGCQSMPGPDREHPAEVRSAAASPARQAPFEPPPVVDVKRLPRLDEIIARLAAKRVVFVGETHDRFDHHLIQLEIIRRLHDIHPDLAIGMEYFQQPFQPFLDAYVAGSLDERSFLKKTEYFERWGFDYRLYRPIIEYARKHSIPLLALNVSQEIRRKVSRSGFQGLAPGERAQVPAEIDRSDMRYRERLREAFDRHSGEQAGDFERFVDVQLLWDESMADRAARYLLRHPERRMVVLAGSGHLAYGSGIPRRLTRRLPVDTAIVLSDVAGELRPEVADFFVLSEEQKLPPPGTLGVILQAVPAGVSVQAFAAGSAAQAAGMRAGDRLLAVDGRGVQDIADVKLAMLDKKPGEVMDVKALRAGRSFQESEMAFRVTLR
jgi:uncharacterized iron-regulated protein